MFEDDEPTASRLSVSRRLLFKLAGGAGAGLALTQAFPALAGGSGAPAPVTPSTGSGNTGLVPSFTGPGPLTAWNSPGAYVSLPQKSPLIQLTDRAVQLETPRPYFLDTFTPNHAFFVRWHLPNIPSGLDLSTWRLQVQGNVNKELALSFTQLLTEFEPVSIAAVNQCSGNSRGRFQPRNPGGQWGNGAMGNALWTGVRLSDVLARAGVKAGSVQAQFQGLETGNGAVGTGGADFIKSLNLEDPALEDAVIAYAMNGEPLPLLNGFPVRLVVPGYFSTYWMKGLSFIRLLSKPDDNFWMAKAYMVPDNPRGNTTPADVKDGKVKMVPITTMPVRSFIVTPDGSAKVPARFPVTVRGVAFSGLKQGGIARVEFSADGGKSWSEAQLGEDYGQYSFRTWSVVWTPPTPGTYTLAVRATDGAGVMQPDEGVWNAGGYMWNRIERQTVVVGTAG